MHLIISFSCNSIETHCIFFCANKCILIWFVIKKTLKLFCLCHFQKVFANDHPITRFFWASPWFNDDVTLVPVIISLLPTLTSHTSSKNLISSPTYPVPTIFGIFYPSWQVILQEHRQKESLRKTTKTDVNAS